jgi:hypothetical protein
MTHKVYGSIIQALKAGRLREPFTIKEFREACPGLGSGTYEAFLYKHRLGNPGKNTELFKQLRTGLFECIKPFKYGF